MGPSEINRPYLILGESLNYIYHIYDFVRSDMRVNIKILFMSNFLTISIKCVPIFSFNLCINCRKVTKFYRLGCRYFCHHSNPKPNSNSPEPELFHRLWLQLKSPAPAHSGSTTLPVSPIYFNNMFLFYCIGHGGIINGTERGGWIVLRRVAGEHCEHYIGEKDCTARFATGAIWEIPD